MNQDDQDSVGLKKRVERGGEFTQLINRAIDPLSIPVKNLIDEWLDSLSAHTPGSSELLERVESQCTSDEELGYVLHLEALVLDHAGHMHQAIDKAHQCLVLSSRIGHRPLEADVLAHMGQMYHTLGHSDLGAEYFRAAEHMRSGAPAPGSIPGLFSGDPDNR